MHYVGGILAGIVLFGMMIMPAQHYVSLVGVAAVIGGGYWFQTEPTRGGITVAAGFVLIAGPGGESVRQSASFLDRLESHQVPLDGVLVNRMHLWPSDAPPPEEGWVPGDAELQTLAEALAAVEGPDFPAERGAREAWNAATGYADRVRSDARNVQSLRSRIEALGGFFSCIPEFDGDVHDLAGLGAIGAIIAGRNQARELDG